MKHAYLFLILLTLGFPCRAQNQITVKEAAEITYQAKETVKAYQSLLNFVVFAENAPNELKDAIENSCSVSRNQIFLNKEAIIEDDIDPDNRLGQTRDLPVEKYLNTLDISYEKDIDPSIAFTSVQVSHVKKKDYLYIKVFFESAFGKANKKKNVPYPVRQRVALLRAEKRGNRWYTFVSGIRFHDPANTVDNTENDIPIVPETDGSLVAGTNGDTLSLTQDKVAIAIRDYEALQEESKRKLQDEFNQAITYANQLYANQEFEEAESAYKKARELNPFNTVPLVQLIRVKRELGSRTYESFLAQAERAKKERRYEEAMDFYQKALQKKPQASDIITRELQPLSQRVNDIASIRNKMESGNIDAAIEECDRKIKDKRKFINDYPEFFLLRGKSYLLSTDRRAKDRALEDFNKTLEIDAYYQEARLIRADYLEKSGNAVGAITDYDVALANIPLEKELFGERAAIATKKVALKNNLKNFKGAIDEYEKLLREAERLGIPKNPVFFYEKGLLEMKKAGADRSATEYGDADKSFSTALTLNTTFTLAYFHRGLARFDLEKYREAAKDFAEAEKLGLDTVYRKTIQSKSDILYASGLQALSEMKLDKAEKAFRNAIVIRPKNAKAWFKKGETLFAGRDMENALEHYNTAISHENFFPEAHYSKGLALSKLSRYQEAIESFGQATQQNKSYVAAYQGAGRAHQKLANYKVALLPLSNAIDLLLAEYKKAKKNDNKTAIPLLKSRLADVYHDIGQCHYQMKSYAEAVKILDISIDYGPDFADAYHYRGLAMLAQDQSKSAIKDLSKAIEYFPEDATYRYALADAFFHHKEYAESIKHYTTVVRIDSLNALSDTKYKRGLCHVKSGSYEKALKDFSDYSVAVSDDRADSFSTDYGFLYLQLKQDSLAMAEFDKVLRRKEQYAEALYGMACVYDMKKNLAEAMQYVEKSILTKKLNKTFVSQQEEFFLKNLRGDKLFNKKYTSLKKKNLASS